MLIERSRKTNSRVHVFKEGMAVSLIMMKSWFKILILNVFYRLTLGRPTEKKCLSWSRSSVSCKNLAQVLFWCLNFIFLMFQWMDLNWIGFSSLSDPILKNIIATDCLLNIFTILLCIYFANASCNLDNNSSQTSLSSYRITVGVETFLEHWNI